MITNLNNRLFWILVLATAHCCAVASGQNLQLQDITVENRNEVGPVGSLTEESNSATWNSSTPFNFNQLATEAFGHTEPGFASAYGVGNSNFEFSNSASVSASTFIQGTRWNPALGPAPNGLHFEGFDGAADSFTTTTVRYTNTGQTGNVNATFSLAPTVLGTTTVAGLGINQSLAFSYFEIAVGTDEANLTPIAWGAHTMDGLLGTTQSTLTGVTAPNFFLSSQHRFTSRQWLGDFGSGHEGFGQEVVTRDVSIFVPVDLDLSLGTVAENEDLVIRYIEQASARTFDRGDLGCAFDQDLNCIDVPPESEPVQTVLVGEQETIYGDFDQVLNALNPNTTLGTAFAQTGDPFSLQEDGTGSRPITSFITLTNVPEPTGIFMLAFAYLFASAKRCRQL